MKRIIYMVIALVPAMVFSSQVIASDSTGSDSGQEAPVLITDSISLKKTLIYTFAIKDVIDSDDLLIITANGIIIRQKIESIKVIGRNTQGVHLIRLDKDDYVADVARVFRE